MRRLLCVAFCVMRAVCLFVRLLVWRFGGLLFAVLWMLRFVVRCLLFGVCWSSLLAARCSLLVVCCLLLVGVACCVLLAAVS